MECGKGDLKKVICYYFDVYVIYEEINFRFGLVILFFNLGFVYLCEKKVEEVEKYFWLSLENVWFMKFIKQLCNVYEGFLKVEKEKGNFKEVLKYFEIFGVYKDFVQFQQGNSVMSEMYICFQIEKKDKELVQQ